MRFFSALRGIGDIHDRQHCKDKCLHRAGEPVEIERQDCRKTYSEDRDIAQEITDSSREKSQKGRGRDAQSSIDQAVDNDTGQDVAEMTAGHTGC